jgi:hypothetical protein
MREESKEMTINNITYVYIVGLEGVGHHGVTPAIAAIARTCNHHVDFASPFLRRMQSVKFDRSYRLYLERWKHVSLYNQNSVLVLEDQSFPSGNLLRTSTALQKQAHPKYDLEWIYSQTRRTDIRAKFLYLSRNFHRTVSSHSEFDGGFEQHAQVLHEYAHHIKSEYEAVSAKQPGIWAQVHYEWFTELRNCTALVSAIIDFAGWDACDVDYACQILPLILRNGTTRTVNATELAIAQSLEVPMPIPALDISANRTYSFARRASSMNVTAYMKAWVWPAPSGDNGPNSTARRQAPSSRSASNTTHKSRTVSYRVTEKLRHRTIGTRERGWP